MAPDIFGALADPTRRHLYRQLAAGGPLTATALASDLDISRQAVAKHLGILAEAGMATSARAGRETRYTASTEPLGEVTDWIAAIQGQWQQRLVALADLVEGDDTNGCYGLALLIGLPAAKLNRRHASYAHAADAHWGS